MRRYMIKQLYKKHGFEVRKNSSGFYIMGIKKRDYLYHDLTVKEFHYSYHKDMVYYKTLKETKEQIDLYIESQQFIKEEDMMI